MPKHAVSRVEETTISVERASCSEPYRSVCCWISSGSGLKKMPISLVKTYEVKMLVAPETAAKRVPRTYSRPSPVLRIANSRLTTLVGLGSAGASSSSPSPSASASVPLSRAEVSSSLRMLRLAVSSVESERLRRLPRPDDLLRSASIGGAVAPPADAAVASSCAAASYRLASWKKTPSSPLPMSSSYVPSSTTRPPLTTAILSAWRIVERRCAIVTVVRRCCAMIESSAACTTRSLSLSSADVASSSSSTAGRRTIARAMAMRCFWPPDSLPPPRPTCVSYPPASRTTKSCALASPAASRTSSSEAPSLPYAMFSPTVPSKRTGSCPTSPSCERSQRRLSVRMSTPSRVIAPPCGS